MLLLHGLGGSERYWGAAYDELAEERRLVVPDLLGFGNSPRSAAGYSADDHADAVAACLVEVAGAEAAVVAAHSVGCVVALRLALRHPHLVSSIVAFCPPLYRDQEHARARLAAMGPLVRIFAFGPPQTKAACEWIRSAHPKLSGLLLQALRPDLPSPLAHDGIRHSWASYAETLRRVIVAAGGSDWLTQVNVPVRLVVGDDDPVTDAAFLAELTASLPSVTLSVWSGGHDLPLIHPYKCVHAIRTALGEGG